MPKFECFRSGHPPIREAINAPTRDDAYAIFSRALRLTPDSIDGVTVIGSCDLCLDPRFADDPGWCVRGASVLCPRCGRCD